MFSEEAMAIFIERASATIIRKETAIDTQRNDNLD